MTTDQRTDQQGTDEHRDQHPGQGARRGDDREPPARGAQVPAASRVRGAGNANDAAIYERTASEEGFRAFWAEESKRIDWIEPWTELLDWQLPYAKWFVGGKLNISANCLDRHVANGLGDKVAYYWEGEPGDTRTLTYHELLDETCRMANALRALGVKKGDRVAIYMPMIPELPVAMLACARIGAPHPSCSAASRADALAGPHRGRRVHGGASPPTAATARARRCP